MRVNSPFIFLLVIIGINASVLYTLSYHVKSIYEIISTAIIAGVCVSALQIISNIAKETHPRAVWYNLSIAIIVIIIFAFMLYIYRNNIELTLLLKGLVTLLISQFISHLVLTSYLHKLHSE
jgi:hypothetical protein